MGACTLPPQVCKTNLDYGVFLQSADDTLVDHNVTSLGQTGVWVDSTKNATITNNLISNIDILDGVDFAATVSTSTAIRIQNNVFRHMSTVSKSAGIRATGQSSSISYNTINEAYAGVLFAEGNTVKGNSYYNTDITQQTIP